MHPLSVGPGRVTQAETDPVVFFDRDAWIVVTFFETRNARGDISDSRLCRMLSGYFATEAEAQDRADLLRARPDLALWNPWETFRGESGRHVIHHLGAYWVGTKTIFFDAQGYALASAISRKIEGPFEDRSDADAALLAILGPQYT